MTFGVSGGGEQVLHLLHTGYATVSNRSAAMRWGVFLLPLDSIVNTLTFVNKYLLIIAKFYFDCKLTFHVVYAQAIA